MRIPTGFGDAEWRADYHDAGDNRRSRGQQSRKKISGGNRKVDRRRRRCAFSSAGDENAVRSGIRLRIVAAGGSMATQAIRKSSRRVAGCVRHVAAGHHRHVCRRLQQFAAHENDWRGDHRDRNGAEQSDSHRTADHQHSKMNIQKAKVH